MRVLGVIPARGGSKGVPRKNIAVVAGKPLLAYSILAAQHSRGLAEVIVSTDDAEIAEVARAWGAAVPFLRPAALATDSASSVEVALHALAFMEKAQAQPYEALLLLQPTTPLRRAEDIDAALHLLASSGAEAVISVMEAGAAHPLYIYTLNEARLQPFLPDTGRVTRRQDFPPLYLRNGAIYAVRRSVLVEQRTFFPQDICPYLMPPERSVNIDRPLDLELAAFFLERNL
ncbi:MAG: acylneuraminate cytidylyltransferase family protein [Anaerolineae bacterium]|nr:acylneuraminate cytidylyltransferase family protein [Anaerolineae bacterium]